jgi:hypothetical protein
MEKQPKLVMEGQPTPTTPTSTKPQPKTTPRIPTTSPTKLPEPTPNNQVERKPNLEEMFSRMMGKLDTRMETQDLALRKLDTKIDQLAQHSQASIQNLEMQVGQLARGQQGRQQGSLPSDTVVNPKEQCKAIALRSGREVELPDDFGKGKEVVVEEEGVLKKRL